MKNYLRILTLMIFPIFCTSCVVFINPNSLKLTDNTDPKISTGLTLTLDETPRPLGSNTTCVEIYENKKNDSVKNKLIKKHEYQWNTINNICLKNGKYKLITYYHYLGKDRLLTETLFNVDNKNSMTNIKIEYPLFVTGKAKLTIE